MFWRAGELCLVLLAPCGGRRVTTEREMWSSRMRKAAADLTTKEKHTTSAAHVCHSVSSNSAKLRSQEKKKRNKFRVLLISTSEEQSPRQERERERETKTTGRQRCGAKEKRTYNSVFDRRRAAAPCDLPCMCPSHSFLLYLLFSAMVFSRFLRASCAT